MKFISSPNFWKGHKNYKRIAVVLHVSAGTLASMDSWFSNPKAKVSAHYGIGKHGELHQYVNEHDTSWAVGVVIKPTWSLLRKGINPNYYTISIEHEGFKDTVWTEAMKRTSTQLVKDICKRHNIPIDREHIIGHDEIDAEKPNITSKVNDIVNRCREKKITPIRVQKQKLLIILLMKMVQLLRKLLSKK